MNEIKISPEALSICDTYLACGQNTQATADHLGISKELVDTQISKRESKNYIDRQFQEAGWMNRHRIMGLFEEMMEAKLTEIREDELPMTDADLLDIMKVMIKFRQDEINLQTKREEPSKQTNIQVNNHYTDLISKVLKQ